MLFGKDRMMCKIWYESWKLVKDNKLKMFTKEFESFEVMRKWIAANEDIKLVKIEEIERMTGTENE
jgi:hypothetical protein